MMYYVYICNRCTPIMVVKYTYTYSEMKSNKVYDNKEMYFSC